MPNSIKTYNLQLHTVQKYIFTNILNKYKINIELQYQFYKCQLFNAVQNIFIISSRFDS